MVDASYNCAQRKRKAAPPIDPYQPSVVGPSCAPRRPQPLVTDGAAPYAVTSSTFIQTEQESSMKLVRDALAIALMSPMLVFATYPGQVRAKPQPQAAPAWP
jgi:hypothetical protein